MLKGKEGIDFSGLASYLYFFVDELVLLASLCDNLHLALGQFVAGMRMRTCKS